MAVGIVDRLELVQVEKHQGEVAVVTARPLYRLVQVVVQRGSVWQARQPVKMCQPDHLLLSLYPFGDVAESLDELMDLAALVSYRGDGQQVRDRVTPLCFQPYFALPGIFSDQLAVDVLREQVSALACVQELKDTLTLEGFDALACHFGKSGICADNVQGCIRNDNGLMGVLKHLIGQPQLFGGFGNLGSL